MNLSVKIFCFIVLAFTQFSNAQIFEIDEFNDQTINVCEGVFQDSNAGSNGNNYLNNEDYIITICPESSGQNIELDFTSFSTQLNADILTIYDGPDNTGTGTTYSGNATQSPGFISATNASGCITIEFFSNASASTTGWSADISCFEPCQEITNPTITSTPSLNGSILSVDVDQEIMFNANADFSSDSSTAIYNWDFGDGSSAQGISPQYTYNTAGSYLITLTITDDCDDNSNTVSIELNAIVGASIPGIPFVDAGDDITLVCDNSTTLRADFLDIGETTSYDVRGIPFVPPFSFSGLENSINISTDDIWDDGEDFPTDANGNQFDFCFFDDFKQQFQVGSNGIINFNPLPSNGATIPSGYAATPGQDIIPNNTTLSIKDANIFTPFHDIFPGVNNQNEISWEIIGEFPNRVLAVSYYDVAMFSCTELLASHMAVIYETTNIIDIYVSNAPNCDFNSNSKIIGIQNDAGTIAFTPDGRNNTGNWETQNEAWRFTPTGDSIVEFQWLDSDGNIISNDPEFEVTVFENETFIAQVTYTTCTGNMTIVQDEINVSIDDNAPYVVDLGDDLEFCEGDGDIVLSADINSPTADYSWTYQGQILQFQNNPTITVSSSFSGIYTAIVSDEGCVIEDDIVITFLNDDSSFEMTATCDGGTATVTGLVGGTFAFETAPTDGALIDSSTGTISGGGYNTTYLVTYTTSGDCPTTSLEPVTSVEPDDSSFEMTSTCDGGTANITGLSGGTFAFDTAPTDGAIIDENTGIVTNGLSNTTYTVSYTTDGGCPTTSLFSVTTIIEDDASFTMTPSCDGGTANVTGLLGGAFVFETPPVDGAVIDAVTGTVTGGGYGTTYLVSYTTNGQCPTTTIVSVTSIIADDSSFEMIPTCDGGTATITGLAGGTFTFDTAPTDGAVIDAVTGTVTGGGYGTTYLVSYTTNGDCPTTTIVSVTSIIADDSSFEMIPTCDGGTATITGLAGGTFTFDTAPTDGAIIDSSTGTVSQGGYGVDYFITYTTNGDCPTSSIVNFSSAVLPVISDPTPFEVCDDNIADGFVEMDLSIKNSEITNGNSNYAVTYYLTSEDASTANSPLTLPYINISNPQTVFIRVVDIIYGCFVTTSMELNVQSAPAANTPSILEYCDADADGFGVFTLTDADAEITSGQTGLVITYHET
ncbi:PKD domain-containing protein, partial [Flavobacteriaceae bacterium]|nr:PKD domain-containing protein [Flavobacteriaceae bacterium]